MREGALWSIKQSPLPALSQVVLDSCCAILNRYLAIYHVSTYSAHWLLGPRAPMEPSDLNAVYVCE
jgi:hypothetical protein